LRYIHLFFTLLVARNFQTTFHHAWFILKVIQVFAGKTQR